MYFVSKDGVKNLNTGEIIEIGSPEWDLYKKWVEDGNEPKYNPIPYRNDDIVKLSIETN